MIRERHTVALAALVVGALALAGCSSSPSGSATPTTGHATTTVPLDTALHDALTRYLAAQGVPPARYTVTQLRRSTVDPRYAIFDLGPTATDKATFAGGYGFLEEEGGTWRGIGFGASQVGCTVTTDADTHASTTPVTVPTAVLKAFGLACPPKG